MLRKILLGVGPWVVFSLVLRFGTMELINVAWIVFFVLHTYFGRHYLKAGNPLSWVSSLLFLILFANGIFGWSYWALQYGAQICYGVFAITALVTVMVNQTIYVNALKACHATRILGASNLLENKPACVTVLGR